MDFFYLGIDLLVTANSMADEVDFFTYHRSATNKLKKRFLKKPNIAEASDEFDRLKIHLARIECFPYAAFTALSKAKCEQGLMNVPGEIDAFVEAARFFLKANQEIEDRKSPNFHENLENAVWCFTCAIRITKDNNMSTMAGSLCLEIAEVYYNLHMYSMAVQHYKNAIQYFDDVPVQASSALNKLLCCQLLEHDYHGALDTAMNLVELIKTRGAFHANGVTPLGFYFDLYKQVEITRVLLLMLLSTSIELKPKYEKVLHDYHWPDEASLATSSHFLDKLLGEELYVYLRSFVMACNWKDLCAARTVQSDIKHVLTQEQNEIMCRIIQNMK